jgi:AraC family transcriptional activator of pobA
MEINDKAPSGVREFAPEHIEARTIKSALTRSEYVLRGGRSHLFLLQAGAGHLSSAEGENALEAPGFFWLPHGKSRSVLLQAGTRGSLLSIPDARLGSAIPAGSLGSHIREVVGYPAIARNPEAASLAKLGELIATIERELFDNGPAAQTVVQYCVSLLLIEFWRLSRPEIASPRALPRNIVHNFMSLVDLHLRDHWTVQQYARQMGVSKDRLNTAVQRATGRTPLIHIHQRQMAEAKTLLTGSSLQVAEVAYMLGFKDAAYFNRFFQRHAGVPPGKFRHNAAQQKSETDTSFAAWP